MILGYDRQRGWLDTLKRLGVTQMEWVYRMQPPQPPNAVGAPVALGGDLTKFPPTPQAGGLGGQLRNSSY